MTLCEMRIGCAMTGSFCTFRAVFGAWRALKATGADLTPIMSFNAASVDTRFYPASEAVAEFHPPGWKKTISIRSSSVPFSRYSTVLVQVPRR